MKIVKVETLISRGDFALSQEWAEARSTIHQVIERVEHPEGSGSFTINPTRKRNGVQLIKTLFQERLLETGWEKEKPIQLSTALQPGNLDFMLSTNVGPPIAIEWETGNVSSSHRSMNKLALGLVQGVVSGAVMIVADRSLYHFLTDRVGNYQKLTPYFPFWGSIRCEQGVLEIVAISHDFESPDVPLLVQGDDGNARRYREKLKNQIKETLKPYNR
ncbi:hypothetical protein BH11ARM2_BH11ARM2_30910 [soil metagenome]